MNSIFWPPAVTRKHDYSRFIGYGLVHANDGTCLFNMITLYLLRARDGKNHQRRSSARTVSRSSMCWG